MVARNWSKSLSLWSRDRRRLLRHDSLAIPKVDKKLAMLMFSRDMYSSLTKSFCWTVAGGPLLYPGLAMLEKAWGTTSGVGMPGNFPISKVFDVLGLTRSSYALWRRERSTTIGSFIDSGLSAFSCCSRRGSRPKAKPSL